MSNNAYSPRRCNWNVTWNAIGLGTVYKVDPDLKLILDPIKRGTTGKVVLGHWIIGLEGSIKVQCADVTALLEQTLIAGQSGGATLLTPELPNTNHYSYAQLLTLHPTDVAALTLTEDLNLIKAAPMTPYNIKRDGEKDDVWEVEFIFYPDVNRLLNSQQLVYGYVGGTAP